MNRRAFVLAALALSGCASGGVRVIAPPNSALSELEPLYRADAGRGHQTGRTSRRPAARAATGWAACGRRHILGDA